MDAVVWLMLDWWPGEPWAVKKYLDTKFSPQVWARTSRSSAMVAIVPAQRNATAQAAGCTAKTHDFICLERSNQGVFPRRRFLRGRVLGQRSLPFLQDQRMFQRSAAAFIHLKRCNENRRRSAI